VDLVGNGSLLFFATTITSKTAGEYFKRGNVHTEAATLICFVVTLLIVISSVFTFGIVVTMRFSSAVQVAPQRVANFSSLLAVAAIIFSFAFTIFIKYSDIEGGGI
jgi:hypothetical protein